MKKLLIFSCLRAVVLSAEDEKNASLNSDKGRIDWADELKPDDEQKKTS